MGGNTSLVINGKTYIGEGGQAEQGLIEKIQNKMKRPKQIFEFVDNIYDKATKDEKDLLKECYALFKTANVNLLRAALIGNIFLGLLTCKSDQNIESQLKEIHESLQQIQTTIHVNDIVKATSSIKNACDRYQYWLARSDQSYHNDLVEAIITLSETLNFFDTLLDEKRKMLNIYQKENLIMIGASIFPQLGAFCYAAIKNDAGEAKAKSFVLFKSNQKYETFKKHLNNLLEDRLSLFTTYYERIPGGGDFGPETIYHVEDKYYNFKQKGENYNDPKGENPKYLNKQEIEKDYKNSSFYTIVEQQLEAWMEMRKNCQGIGSQKLDNLKNNDSELMN